MEAQLSGFNGYFNWYGISKDTGRCNKKYGLLPHKIFSGFVVIWDYLE